MPFIQGRNESIKWYKIKHASIESFSYVFCPYTDMRNSFDIHVSGCTHLRTKAWMCFKEQNSLSEFSRELCCSLLFENHILQVSQIFPVTSTHRPLSGSLWWPQWPRKWCELEALPWCLVHDGCISLVWELPIGGSALLSSAEELLSFPACRADVGTGSGCLFFSFSASPHRNLTLYGGNSIGNIAFSP